MDDARAPPADFAPGSPGGFDPASPLRPMTTAVAAGDEAALGAALRQALWDGSLDGLLNNTRYARMLMAEPSPKSRRAVQPEPKDAKELLRLNRSLQLELRAQREANDALLLAASDAQKAKRVAEEIAKAQLEAIGREKASRRSRAAPIAEHGVAARPWAAAPGPRASTPSSGAQLRLLSLSDDR